MKILPDNRRSLYDRHKSNDLFREQYLALTGHPITTLQFLAQIAENTAGRDAGDEQAVRDNCRFLKEELQLLARKIAPLIPSNIKG